MSDYNAELKVAFEAVLKAEAARAEAESDLEKITHNLKMDLCEKEMLVTNAMLSVEKIMKAQGVLEDFVPGDGVKYKLYYSTPHEKVKVPDVNAVPEEYIKTEKSAKLAKIGEHLKELRVTKAAMPNWATLEMGTSKLSWKALKA